MDKEADSNISRTSTEIRHTESLPVSIMNGRRWRQALPPSPSRHGDSGYVEDMSDEVLSEDSSFNSVDCYYPSSLLEGQLEQVSIQGEEVQGIAELNTTPNSDNQFKDSYIINIDYGGIADNQDMIFEMDDMTGSGEVGIYDPADVPVREMRPRLLSSPQLVGQTLRQLADDLQNLRPEGQTSHSFPQQGRLFRWLGNSNTPGKSHDSPI